MTIEFTIDATELEIVYHQFKALTEEMGITLGRTARSTYVKEAGDFGTALCGLDGKFFAYPAEIGVAGSIDSDCSAFITAFDDIRPGDILATNDPYRAGGVGSHLPDLNLLKPYFHEGELVCFGWTFVHSADVGGSVPSSIAPSLRNIYQEGVQIPPVKLARDGVLCDDIISIFCGNSRVPAINLGDLKAQLAALAVGERRVAELIEAHGIDKFKAAQRDLLRYGKARALDVQRRIPDGTWVFWDYMDDDFVTKIPIRLRCSLTVKDGHFLLDFTGSDPQVTSAYNVPTGGVRHNWVTYKIMHLLRTFDADMPLNSGVLDNVSVVLPKGTVMNPESPGAVGIRHATAIRINDAIMGCLSQACPGIVPAPSGGTVIPFVVSQLHRGTGMRSVAVLQSLVGGAGAGDGYDGTDARDRSLSNVSNTPLERGEADNRIRVEAYTVRPDSGGPGRYRGGCGVIFTVRVLEDETEILGRGLERFVFRPWGMEGGAAGAPARVILNIGTSDEKDLGKIDLVRANAGDTITVMTAGGGGYGDPLKRSPALVARDVRRGHVAFESALLDYGVALDAETGQPSIEATERLRSTMADALPTSSDTARGVFETVFSDELMTPFAGALLTIPAGIRGEARHRIMERVVPGIMREGLAAFDNVDVAAARSILVEEISRLQVT